MHRLRMHAGSDRRLRYQSGFPFPRRSDCEANLGLRCFCDDSDANFTLNALGVTISSGWGEPVDETKEEKPTFEGFRANLKAMVSDAITLQCFDEARVLIDILENLSGE